MKKILFRGKTEDEGRFISGGSLEQLTCSTRINGINVDSETVGQFIGLTDKSGIKVFKGDIVFVNDGFIGKKREIVWIGKEHGWGYKTLENVTNAANKNIMGLERLIQFHRVDDIEVIGNIHDNK
jgi:uncharacterized phage protein (TIGR01671 family)